MTAVVTPNPQEAVSQDPALEKLVEFLADIVGDSFSGNTIGIGKEGLDILGDRLIQNRLFGTTASIIRKDGLQRNMEGIRQHEGPETQDPGHERQA